MGSKVSIDKHVSPLEDILQINPIKLAKINFVSDIPSNISQHIKIWRFYEEDQNTKTIKSQPITLQHLQSQSFNFQSNECYLVFVVYKKNQTENNSFVSFPQSMWGLVESHNNLTPRGLVSPVAESCTGPGILDSFLLPQSQDQNNTNKFYQYMIYVWNGKTANPFIKSFSLSQAFELEKLIVKGGENILNILFSGGVIRSKKLQKGSIIQLNSQSNDQTINKEIIKELRNMSQTVYLLKFLFHDQSNSMCNLSYNNNNGSFNSLNSNNNQLQQGQKQNTNQSFENNHNNQSISNSLQPDEFQELEEEDDKRDKFQHFRNMFLNQKNYNNNQNNNEFQYESNFIGFNPQSYKQLQQFQQTQANNGYEDQDDYYHYQNQFQFQSQQNNYIDQNYNNINNNDFNDFQMQQNNTEQFQDKQIPQFNLNIPNQNFNLQNDQQLQYQQNFDQQQYKQQNEFNQFGYQDEQVQYNPEYNQNQIQDGQYQNDADKNYGQYREAQSKNFKQDFKLNLNQLNNNFVSSEDEKNLNDQEQKAKQNQSNKPGFQLNLNFQNQGKNQNQNNVNNNQNVNSQSSRNSQINSLSSNRQNPVLSLGIQHNQFQKQIQMDLEDYQSPQNQYNYDNQQQNYNQSNQQSNQDFQNLNNNTNNFHLQKKQHNLALNLNNKQNETQEIQQQQPQGFQLNLESANNFKKNNVINKLELPQKNNTNLQYIPGKTRTDQTGTEACADPIKLQQIYADICSEVVPGKLYLSGQNVAFNKQLLQEVGITHIINCAGNVCPSKFTEEIQYKTYFLKDAKEENIESIFYETNFFMEEAFQNGGKVLVHCHKGVSRSVTLCMAYIIWKNKLTFDQAFQQVKNSRDIASPNPGFLVQLINYDKRITQGYDSILISPRVFLVCSHQLEQPELVVAKMLLENLFDVKRQYRKLDKRGIFIIQTQDKFYLWVGSKCQGVQKQLYQEVAQKHINLLQQYESGGEEIITINEGEENEDFWKLWGYDKQPEEAVGENSDWDNWFLDLEPEKLQNYQPPRLYYKECISESSEDQRNQQNNNDVNDSQEQNITETIPILFIFPESRQAVKMFDMDDLQEDSLCILCKQEGNILKQFVWRGYKVEGDEFIEHQFANDIIANYYGNRQFEQILKFKEDTANLSDEFIECFDDF